MTSTECYLCDVDLIKDELIKLECGHSFCWHCLDKFIVSKINKSTTTKITCPQQNCATQLKYETIAKVISDGMIEKYDKMIFWEFGTMKINCLSDQCDYFLESDDNNVQFDCPNCSLYTCGKCRQPHRSKMCSEFQTLTPTKQNTLCQKEFDRASTTMKAKQLKDTRDSIVTQAKAPIVANKETFECELCYVQIPKGAGIQLKNCFHEFCKTDFKNYVKTTNDIPITCPSAYCQSKMEESEIRHYLNETEIGIYEQKSMARVKSQMPDYYHCQAGNCNYFCELNRRKNKKFTCPSCKSVNCLKCEAVHNGESCEEYATKKKQMEKQKQDLLSKGDFMECPDCKNLVQKADGCNWIQCNCCGLELCWILKMRRWGPNGPGDVSDGCKCMIGGKFCHPDCRGCIPDNRPMDVMPILESVCRTQ